MTSLSERYYRPKAFERSCRLYAWLGVVWFKRRLTQILRPDPANPTDNAYVLVGRSLAAVRTFERRSRRSEAIHLAGLVLAAVCLVLAAGGGGAGILTAGVVLFVANFHCFILQRYNRVRIYRVLQRERRAD